MSDYGARIRQAYRDWHTVNDPKVMTWAEIQRRVAKLLKKPETSVAVLKWKDGQQEPTIAEFRALGRVLEADPGALAFGTQAGRVEIPMEPEQPLPVELQKPTKRRRGTG